MLIISDSNDGDGGKKFNNVLIQITKNIVIYYWFIYLFLCFRLDRLCKDFYLWSRGQMEICGLFCEFVAPPRKRNYVAIMAQRYVLET